MVSRISNYEKKALYLDVRKGQFEKMLQRCCIPKYIIDSRLYSAIMHYMTQLHLIV